MITFHSLEDRIAKRVINYCAKANRMFIYHHQQHYHHHHDDRSSPSSTISSSLASSLSFPAPSLVIPYRGALAPTEEEIRANRRSRSAKLRIAQRTQAPPVAHKTLDMRGYDGLS